MNTQTLRIGVDDRTLRQRLECGDFSTALERAQVDIGSWMCRADESGGERAALQTLRAHAGHCQSRQRLAQPWALRRNPFGILLCFCLLFSALSFQAWGQVYKLGWSKIAGGGIVNPPAAGYSVSCTIGQPEAEAQPSSGLSGSTTYSFNGGFWAFLGVAALPEFTAPGCLFTNTAGGNWSVAANWSPNQVPGPLDAAYITLPGNYTVAVDVAASVSNLIVGAPSGTQTLAISTQVLTLSSAGVVNGNGVLALSGGTITGAGSLSVNGAFNWTGGYLSVTNVTVNDLLTISGGGNKSLEAGTLVNMGTATWSGGTLFMYSPAGISNGPSGTFNVAFGGILYLDSGNPLFVNAGQLNVNAGSGNTATMQVAFNNSGSVSVASGTLTLQDGDGGTTAGSIGVAAGSTLNLPSGTYNCLSGSSVNGAGNVSLSGATFNENGTFNLSGTTTVSAGTLNFPAGGTIPGVLNLFGSTSGGTLTGAGILNVNGAFNWTGGFLSATNVTVNNGLTLSGGANKNLEAGTLVNTGTATWSAGALFMSSSAVISNAASGTFNVTFGGTVVLVNGNPLFVNAGQLNANLGSGNMGTVEVAFNNSGSVSNQSGTFVLEGGDGGITAGSFGMAASSTLNLSGGTYNFLAASRVTGAGNFSDSGATVNESGAFSVAGTNTFSGGTANFQGSYTVPGVLNLAGSTLAASNGAFNVTGPMTWSGGTIQGNSSINSLGGLTISGTGTKFVQGPCTLVNSATANWSGGPIEAYAPSAISNALGGTFNLNSAGTLEPVSGNVFFANAGQLNVNAGNGNNVNMLLGFNNSGSVSNQSGMMTLEAGGTNAGSFNIAASSTLNLSGGTFNFLAASSVTGAGTFTVSSGTLNETGAFSVAGTNTFSGGTANFQGSYTVPGALNLTGTTLAVSNGAFNVTGPMTWTYGIIQGNSSINSLGGLTISGAGTKTVQGPCTLVNSGTANWSGGPIEVYAPSAISNALGGTFNLNSAGTLEPVSGNVFFANAGQLNVNAGNGNNVNMLLGFNNSGSVSNQSGMMTLEAGGTNAGSFNIAASSTLNLSGGTFNFLAASSVTGAGTFTVSSGTLNETGAFNVAGTNTFSGGTANFQGSYTVPGALNLTGTTLAVSNGAFNVTGPMTWTYGIIQGNSSFNSLGGLTISGAGTKTVQGPCTLVNSGTANWSGGPIEAYAPSAISNALGGTFNLNSAGTLEPVSGNVFFANAGQLNVNAGNGNNVNMLLGFNNSGSVAVTSGTLDLTLSYSQTAGLTLLNGGNINNTSALEIQGGTLAGSGSIYGSVTNNGTVSPGAPQLGGLNIGGNYVQTANGVLNIALGGTMPGTSFDLLMVTNTAALGGALNVTFANGFFPASNSVFTYLNAHPRTNTFANFVYPSNLELMTNVYATNSASLLALTGPPQSGLYALGATSLVVGPAAGSNSVILAANPTTATWTASTNTTWLHLGAANQGGTGSTNVIFSYDPNTNATRTGTLTIAGQTVTITQAGSTYVQAPGPVTTLVSSGTNEPEGVAVDRLGNVYWADANNNAVEEWIATNNTVITLFSNVVQNPYGVAVDGGGNLYVADNGHNAIKEWIAASNTVVTLVSNGLSNPFGVAVDSVGNVYIGNAGSNSVVEWIASSNTVITLVATGLNSPQGVAVDAAGNVYIADHGHSAIKEWNPANGNVVTLVSVGTSSEGVAVDGSGNVYFAVSTNGSIGKWTAAGSTVTTLATGLGYPSGVAVDGTGNVYFANGIIATLMELPYAFVDPTPKSETAAAGTDILPVVLPASENLLPPFEPYSSQSWLTITGVSNGVVSFSFATNTAATSRTANLTLLGQSMAVTQSTAAAATPPVLTGVQIAGNDVFNFSFTNNPGASFTVWTTTNLSLPLAGWTVAGIPTNNGSGLYQFAAPATQSGLQRFYRVTSP